MYNVSWTFMHTTEIVSYYHWISNKKTLYRQSLHDDPSQYIAEFFFLLLQIFIDGEGPMVICTHKFTLMDQWSSVHTNLHWWRTNGHLYTRIYIDGGPMVICTHKFTLMEDQWSFVHTNLHWWTNGHLYPWIYIDGGPTVICTHEFTLPQTCTHFLCKPVKYHYKYHPNCVICYLPMKLHPTDK
jgi:hypothetical protein